jgi:hypothetical protein
MASTWQTQPEIQPRALRDAARHSWVQVVKFFTSWRTMRRETSIERNKRRAEADAKFRELPYEVQRAKLLKELRLDRGLGTPFDYPVSPSLAASLNHLRAANQSHFNHLADDILGR